MPALIRIPIVPIAVIVVLLIVGGGGAARDRLTCWGHPVLGWVVALTADVVAWLAFLTLWAGGTRSILTAGRRHQPSVPPL